MATNTAFFIELYRRMLMVRQVEGRLAALFADGEIAGFIHLDIGLEAAAIGGPGALEGNPRVQSPRPRPCSWQGHPIGAFLWRSWARQPESAAAVAAQCTLRTRLSACLVPTASSQLALR